MLVLSDSGVLYSLQYIQDQEEDEDEKKNIEEDRRSVAKQVRGIVDEIVNKDMYGTFHLLVIFFLLFFHHQVRGH